MIMFCNGDVGGGGRCPPHPAQSQHANHWAPRTRKRHQQEHRPQRPTESSDPTQHAKGRTGDRPGPRKGATTRRNVTQGGGVLLGLLEWLGTRAFWPMTNMRKADVDILPRVGRSYANPPLVAAGSLYPPGNAWCSLPHQSGPVAWSPASLYWCPAVCMQTTGRKADVQ